jgi:2-polyprenyl-6-methoxyphenol hydroxylase-like FAD-dependent oxidoreductase
MDCCIVGGGPAGMMLGLILARAGVTVTVLEKHEDFLRDFRGDTVHASTLALLDELGLGGRFSDLPQRRVSNLELPFRPSGPVALDLGLLRGPHKHIAVVPQWDLLALLAQAAGEEPGFTLRMATEATGLLREGGRVAGVRLRDGGELRAALTIAADGRGSVLRAESGLSVREFGVPLDVWWLRLPRREGDPAGLIGRTGDATVLILIDRGDYFQMGIQIRKGSDARQRENGVEALRARIARLAPELADRVDLVRSLDEVQLLSVRLNRMPRWFQPGLLFIGDAAHAMSPVGGVGINLAIQDAVAAGRTLAGPLRRGHVSQLALARVQARRWAPTVVTQTLQRALHRRVTRPGLAGEPARPLAVSQRTAARLFAIGVLPEHAPRFARR